MSKPYIKCDVHGNNKVKGYVWCLHITLAMYALKRGDGKQTENQIKENIGLIIKPTDTEYGVILCSTLVEHPSTDDPTKWNLVCERCLVDRGWIKPDGEQAPMVTLASELPKDLDWDKLGLKRKGGG